MRVVFAANIMPEELAAKSGLLASARYRGVIPADALRRSGVDAEVISASDLFHPEFDCNIDLLVLHQPKADVVLLKSPLPTLLNNMDRIRAYGGVVALDVSDFKFTPEFTKKLTQDFGAEVAIQYRNVLDVIFAHASAVTTPTESLATLLRSALPSALPVSVIGDVVEVERRPARFAPNDELNLLWFGLMGSHAKAMQLFLGRDLAVIDSLRTTNIVLVCEPLPNAPNGEIRRQGKSPIRVVQWSVPALEQALAECDLVVLPFKIDSLLSRGKSNNRALQALYAGRAVVAHPMDSYLPLGEFIGLDHDLPRAVAMALADPQGMQAKLECGQAYVAEQYSSAAVGQRWLNLLSQLIASSTAVRS